MVAVTRSQSERMVRKRTGVALLIVLAMIVLIVPIAVGMARQSILTRVQVKVSNHDTIASLLSKQLELGPIIDWLEHEASKTVLDVDNQSPVVAVFSDSWTLDGIAYEVKITAWDQCGMAPVAGVQRGSVWRLTIPAQVTGRLPIFFDDADKGPLGLDQLSTPLDQGDSLGPSAFPTSSMDDPFAVGAWIATHPVGKNGSINVNTAPLRLIESAMRLAGRGGLEQIRTSRTEGKRALLPAAISSQAPQYAMRTDFEPRFASVSSSWALRIDVHVGTVKRSWWTVYRNHKSQWECVQRLVITD